MTAIFYFLQQIGVLDIIQTMIQALIIIALLFIVLRRS